MLIFSFVLAGIMEVVDSSLGMMYGTLLSPLLILLGFDTKIVVPSIVISQALGGLIATIQHNRLRTGDFSGFTRDTKVVLSVVLPGIFACVIAVLIAVKVPAVVLIYYIGALVTIMGFLCIFPLRYKFAWWKMCLIGAISSFNKAISGGGFGPITSTGKILGGLDSKTSVSTTTFAEVPICLVSFALWYFLQGGIDWMFAGTLCFGAAIGGFIGPYITARIDTRKLRIIVGVLAIVSGVLIFILKKTT